MSDYTSDIKVIVDDSALSDLENKIKGIENKKVKVDTKVDNSGLSKASEGLKQVEQSAKGSGKTVDGLGQSMGNVSKNTLAAVASYKVFNATIKQLKEAVSEVEALNSALTTVHMTMQDISNADLGSLKSQILDMSNELSTYVDTVSDAVKIYANANESISTIMQKAEPTVLLASAAETSASDAADTVQGILNQFKMADDAAMGVVDTLEGLSAEMKMDFAKGIQNVSDAVKVSGSVIDSAGMSFERYASIVSATAESTRLSGSVLGNAFKTISSRIGRSKDGETTDAEKADAERAYNSIGISLRNTTGDIQDLDITLESLSKVWGTLNRSQQNYIAEQSAGVRQISVFKNMMDNYSRALELEQKALNSSGTAMKVNETRVESIEGKMQKLSSTMSKMYNDAISEDAIMDVLDLANGVAQVADKLGLLQGAFAALGTAGIAKGIGLISSNWEKLLSVFKSPVTKISVGVGLATSAAIKGFELLDDKFTLTASTAQKHMEESASAYESNYSELQSINSELETTSSRIDELKGKGKLNLTEEAELVKLERQNSLLEAQQKIMQSATDAAQKQAASDAATSINFKSEKSTQTRTDKNGMNMEVAIDRKEYVREQVALMEEAQRQIDQATEKINSGDKSKKWEEQLQSATDNLNEYKENATNTLSDLNSEAENLYDESTGNVIKGYEGLVNEIDNLNNLVNNFDLSPTEKKFNKLDSFFSDKSFLSDMLQEAKNEGKNLEDVLNSVGLSLSDIGDNVNSNDLEDYFKKATDAANKTKDAIDRISVSDVEGATDSENQDKNWSTIASAWSEAKKSYKEGKIGTDDFQQTIGFLVTDKDRQKLLKETQGNAALTYKKMYEQYQKTADKYFNPDDQAKSYANAYNALVSANLLDDGKNTDTAIANNFNNSAQAAKAFGVSLDAAEVILHNMEAYGMQFADNFVWAGENLSEFGTSLETVKQIYDSMQDSEEKTKLGDKIKNWESAYSEAQTDIDALTEDQVISIKFEIDKATLQKENDDLLQNIADSGGSMTAEQGASIIGNNRKIITESESEFKEVNGKKKWKQLIADSTYQAYQAQIDKAEQELSSASANNASEEERASLQQKLIDTQEKYKQYLEDFLDGTTELPKTASKEKDSKTSDKKESTSKTDKKNKKQYEDNLPSSSSESSTNFNYDKLAKSADKADKATKKVADSSKEIPDGVMEADEAISNIMDEISSSSNDAKEKTDDTTNSIHDMQSAAENTVSFNIDTKSIDDTKTDLEKLQETTDGLEAGGEITYTANVGNVEAQITAIKNEDGTVTYMANTGEVITQVEPVLNQDGTIEYKEVGAPEDKEITVSATDATQTVFSAVRKGLDSIQDKTVWIKAINSAGTVISSVKRQLDALKDKHVTITTTKKTESNGKAQVKSHYYGTAYTIPRSYPIGKAYAKGTDWSLHSDQSALVNEVGNESIVRNGMWQVIPGGAHVEQLKKGDIVFSAAQTRELIKYGKVMSGGGHGRVAYANGTAYNTIPAYGGSTVAIKPPSSGSSGTKKTTTKSGSSGKKKKPKKTKKSAWDSFTDSLSNLFDWAEIKLDRLKSKTEKWADAAERAIDKGNFSSATDKYKKAISSIRKEIEANTTAASKYKSKAKSIGLKAAKADGKGGITASRVNAIMKKIANGTLNINSYGEKKRTVIEEMQKWYDKSLDCSEAVSDLTNQMDDYYESLYNLPIEKATSAIEKLSDSLDRLKDKADLAMKGGITNLYSRLTSEKSTAESEKNTASKQLKSAEKASDSADSAVSKAKKKLPANLKKKIGKDGYINTKGLKGSSLKKANAYNALVKKQKSASSKKASAKDNLKEKTANYDAATSTYNAIIGSQGNLYDNNAPDYKIANSIIDEENKNALAQKNDLKKAEQETVKNENDAISKVSSKGNSILNKYKKKLSKSQIAAIKAGKKVSTSGIKDKNLLKQLKAYNESVVARQQASKARETAVNNAVQGEIDYATTLQDNEEEKFNNIKTYYGNQIEYQKALNEQQEKSIDLAKAHGDYVKQEDYDVQISNLQKERQLAEAEAKALTSQLNSSVKSGIIAEGSEQWLDMNIQIIEAENSVKDYAEQIENLSQESLELKYEEMFDRVIEKAEKYINKLETINDLITEEMMYDSDTGQLTDMGMLSLALNKGEMDRNINSLQSYVKKRQEIINDYNKGSFGEEKFNELMDDVDSNIQSYISSISSLRDKVLDIIKSQSEAEVNAITKVIDARKELLDKQKDYYDYDKTLKSKTNDIQLLEQQIRALDGVTDAESRAQKARLEAQLQEAKDDLESTVKDHVYELQVSGLDELSDMLNEDYEKYVKELSSNLEKMTNAINTALNSTASNTTNALKLMGELLKPYGVTLEEIGITGFASGTKYVSKSGMYLTDENGEEIIVTKQGILRRLNQGDGVVPNDLTERLYEMAETYPMWQNQIPQIVQPEFNIVPNRNVDSINPVIECPITIMGNANEQDVENAVKKTIPMISKTVQNDIRKDLRKGGWK